MFAYYAHNSQTQFLQIMVKIDQEKPLLDYHSICSLCFSAFLRFFAYYAHFYACLPNINHVDNFTDYGEN